MKSKTVIMQMRFEPALLEKITEAASRTGLSKADVMRLAMETGLLDLKRVNFDLPALISQNARIHPVAYPQTLEEDSGQTLRCAEDS